MLNRPIRNVQDFLLSTYFADGLRITFGVLCPALIFANFGLLKLGITLSLGALCISVVDSPGPIIHRRNAMIITTILIFITSIVVGISNKNIYFIGFLLVISSFLFSMFFLYGTRATAIGTAVLLIMVLSIDDIRPWRDVVTHALLILGGSVWYSLLSYFVYRLRPYRLLQQMLSEFIYEIGIFLRAKAKFYSKNTNYETNYADLLQLQVLVHEKQDAVREILFKTREIVRESTPEGRFLLLVFVDIVDLFEQIMSTYYNYKQLHEQFDPVGILTHYETIIYEIANALDDIAFALKTGSTPTLSKNLIADVAKLKAEIIELEKNNENGKYPTLGLIALTNIEVNIENILGRIKTIDNYFNKKEKKYLKNRDIDVDKFITKQSFDLKLMLENISFNSATFRHSLRVAIAMFIGFVLAKGLNFAHSYWILLTILVILKPGFSLTKKRNYERLIGTIIGAVIGMAILKFVNDSNTLFAILLICMVGCYSFQRKNYTISVLFMTPYILVLFDFLGIGTIALATERIYDTLIGSGIAFLASYALFPNWEHEKLKLAMLATIKANTNYFEQVVLFYFEKLIDLTAYKVARKEVYVSTANLASMFQRMFSEPKSKQLYIKELHQFTVLNHLFSSYTASLSHYNKAKEPINFNTEILKPIANNTIYLLNVASENLVNAKENIVNVPLIRRKKAEETDDTQLPEQFELIQKVAYDIFKLTEKIKI